MNFNKLYTSNPLLMLFIFLLSCGSVIGQKKSISSWSGVFAPVGSPKSLILFVNGGERMRIDEEGNVGIGSNSPNARLTIYSDTKNYTGVGLLHTDGYTMLESKIISGSAFFGTASDHSFSLIANNSPRLTAFNDGTVSVPGSLGIGTSTPGTYKLAVEGVIGARSIEVKATPWADFVFAKNYKLRPLKDVEDFINTHKHLPDVPSEEQVKKDGIDLGKMSATLLQKIEELTLYTIEQNKRIEAIEKENALLKKKLSRK